MRLSAGLLLLLCGCLDSQFLSTTRLRNHAIEVPDATEASHATHARVDQVGRTILRANLFLGIEPSFNTIGNKTALLFHRDENGLFISDSLVDSCKTDEELAAVLCSELAKMVAEKRNLQRMGMSEPPINIATPNSMEAGGIPADQVYIAETAMRQKTLQKRTSDPKKIARELLKTAGYNDSAMDSAEARLRQLNQDQDVLRQLGGSGTAPTWSP